MPPSLFYRQKRKPMVPKGGLEPPHLTAYAPQAYVSTNSTTWANVLLILGRMCTCTPLECRPLHGLVLGSMALEYSLSLVSNRASTNSTTWAKKQMVHPVGFEPTTNGFEDRYSSNWAMGASVLPLEQVRRIIVNARQNANYFLFFSKIPIIPSSNPHFWALFSSLIW